MKLAARWTAVLVCAPLAGACAPAASAASYAENGFVERPVARNLTQPVAMAWAPGGRLFVTEKQGIVKTLPPGAPEGSTPTTLLDLRPRVNSFEDRGLLGIAVDSQFPSQPYLYLVYTYDPYPLTPDSSGSASSRLVRIKLTADGQLADPVAPETVILGTEAPPLGGCPVAANTVDCIPSDETSHSIGTVRSLPDGSLILGSGDAAGYGGVDELALRALDEQSFAGKLIRVDRQGRGLPGHAFCPSDTDLDHVCAKLYAKGLRNPFRFTRRPGGGLAVGDVGWNSWEEIQLNDGAGRNYGWPCYEGTTPTSGYSDLPRCRQEYENPTVPHTPPDHRYGHLAVGGGAVVGGPEYEQGPYPARLRGALFFGDYAQGFLRYLQRDGSGALEEKPFASAWSGTDLELTPAGELAYADVGDFGDGSGTIKRIAFGTPVARPTADPTSGAAPLDVAFDGSASSDVDGDSLNYSWDFGDGTAHSTQQSPTHRYARPGAYTARLTVDDGKGASASDTVRISAGNDPPRVDILAPADRSAYSGGQSIELRGEATDPQDGPLLGQALQWRVETVHDAHFHQLASPTGAQAGFTADDDHDADSHVEVTLTATDSGGLRATRTIRIDPRTVPLRLRSGPPGVVVSFAGSAFTTPFERTTAVGFRTSVSAPQTFSAAGRGYTFAGWSDGGARLHDLTVPDGPLLLEARYREQTTGKSPSPAAPAADPAPADRTGPRVRFGRAGFDARRGVLAGRAEDASGVKQVKLALLRRVSGQCRFWSARRRGLGRRASCRRPRAMTAVLRRRGAGKVSWRLKLGRSLPEGAYRLTVIARDGRGNRASTFVGGRRSYRLEVG